MKMEANEDGVGIDQIVELAQYIDTISKTNPSQGLSLDIENLVENDQKEEALQKTVAASAALSSAPERGMRFLLPCPHLGDAYQNSLY